MSHKVLSSIQYRDRDLNKVTIEIGHGKQNGFNSAFDIHFNSGTDNLALVLLADKLFIKPEDAINEIEKLAKWLVLNGTYQNFTYPAYGNYQSRELTKDVQKSGFHYSYINNLDFKILSPDLSNLQVEERLLARKIILSILYDSNSETALTLRDKAHFSSETIERELIALNGSKLIGPPSIPGGSSAVGTFTLTFVGSEYYEKSLVHRRGVVFIIAACNAPIRGSALDQDHITTLSKYKSIVESLGLEPIVQEHEEPKKNIFVDIFDYIDTCEFVIADLTFQRPNCYIEIGYALARAKPVLLYIEKSYFENDMGGKLPFDISPVKMQDYLYKDLADLEKKLRERIQVIRSRKS